MKYLVVLAFLAIFACLAAALFFMLRGSSADPAKANHMAWALAFRVGVSIVLFICVLLGWKLGYIHPTGLPVQ